MEKPTIAEDSSDSAYNDRELEVADILINLKDSILKPNRSCQEFDLSPFLLAAWGGKGKRSVVPNYSYSTQSPPTPAGLPPDGFESKKSGEVNADVPSPITPLLYPPGSSESDDKPNLCLPRQSNFNKKREDLVQGLRQSTDSLRRELQRVEAYYNESLALNTQLKLLRQKAFCSRAPQGRVEPRPKKPESCSFGPRLSSSNQIALPSQQMLLIHPTVVVDSQRKEPIQFIHSQVSQPLISSGHIVACVNPDVNISAGFDPAQTWEYFLAKQAHYAEARKERKRKRALRR